MSILTRRLSVAALAAAAACAGATPALAAPRASSTAAQARTPLVTAIDAQIDRIRFRYRRAGDAIQAGLGYSGHTTFRTVQVADTCRVASAAVDRVRADAAQRMAQREWILGVYVEAQGDDAAAAGDAQLSDHHQAAGIRAIDQGLADWSLSNYYIAHADASLGIPHPVRNVEQITARPGVASDGPATLHAPVGLVATITMGDPALQETIPDTVQDTLLGGNEAAASYDSMVVAGVGVDGAQRAARQEWLAGVRTLLRGDELLGRGERTHDTGNPATGNREMRNAFPILRDADTEIIHADARLGIHDAAPPATLPAHATYYGD